MQIQRRQTLSQQKLWSQTFVLIFFVLCVNQFRRSRSRDRRYRSRSRSHRRDYPTRDEGCFKCGQPGHIKRNCPEMRRSFGGRDRSRSPSYRNRKDRSPRDRVSYRREERRYSRSHSRSRDRDYRKRRMSHSRDRSPRNPER